MDLRKFLLLGALISCAGSLQSADQVTKNTNEVIQATQPTLQEKAPIVSKEVSSKTEEENLLKAFGYLLAERTGLSNLGLTDHELNIIFNGIKLNIQGNDKEIDLKLLEKLPSYLDQKEEKNRSVLEKKNKEISEKNKKEEEQFLIELKKDPEVKITKSGLCYKILPSADKKDGKAEKVYAKEKSTVKAEYEGKLINGQVFDSSEFRNGPAEFPLENVIPGFREGLQLIPIGEEGILYIPAQLAYGEASFFKVPPSSLLIFRVKVISSSDNAGPTVKEPVGSEYTTKTEDIKMEAPSTVPTKAEEKK